MANLLKRLISYFIIFALIVNSTAIYAQENQKDFIDTINDFEDEGGAGLNKNVARPLTRFALKKLGTPGFMLGKYMQYRRLINRIPDACTLSEKMTKASLILSILADVTNNVVSFKDERDLTKEFKEKKEKIDEMLKEGSALSQSLKENKDITSIPSEEADLQFLAIDYLITKEEKDLKRLKIVRIIRYPAVALQLIANIINATEMFMEGTSFGAYIAKVNACETAHQPTRVAQEAKTVAKGEVLQARSEEAKKVVIEKEKARIAAEVEKSKEANQKKIDRIENFGGTPDSANSLLENIIPWFLEHFKWLAKLDLSMSPYKGQLNKSDGQNQQTISEAAESQGGDLLSGVTSFMDSANYSEEMIVNVIMHYKKDSKKSGFTGALIDDLSDRAVRYAVRSLVKANIVSIDGFLRSAAGRAIIYLYNLWLTYTEIDQHEEAIKYTEFKIQILKEYRAKIEKATRTVFKLNKPDIHSSAQLLFVANFLKDFIAGNINAISDHFDDTSYLQNLKICISEDKCKNRFSLLNDPLLNQNFNLLPKNIKESHFDLLKNSYTVSQFSKISKGQAGLISFDLEKVKKEISINERKLNNQHILLDRKKILTFKQIQEYEEKLTNANIEPFKKYLRDDFASITNPSVSSLKKETFELDKFKNFNSVKGVSKNFNSGEVFKPNPFAINGVGSRQPSNDSQIAPEYEFKDSILRKDQNIFEMIKNRYMKHYESLGVIE